MKIVDLEGSYVVVDHGDMRLCVDGRKGDSIAVVDHDGALRDRRSMNEKDCVTRTCAEDNYSRVGHNWNHGIHKGIRGSTRIIAERKVGWFETTLAYTCNLTLAQGHYPGSYEGGANANGAYACN
jgi:hypothetical protein